MSFVLNVVLLWSRISSNNVLLSDLQPFCSMASMCSRRRLFLQLVWQVFDSRVFRTACLLVVTYQLDLSATMKMWKLCEINEIVAQKYHHNGSFSAIKFSVVSKLVIKCGEKPQCFRNQILSDLAKK